MRLTINDKNKIDMMVALFQLFKNCTVVVKLEFLEKGLIIQGMDKSHICLFLTDIKCNWFTSFAYTSNTEIMVDSSTLLMVLSRIQENQLLIMEYNVDKEALDIEVLCNTGLKKEEKIDYNRYFQIPLIELDQDTYNMPEVNYDAEFTINAKQLNDLMSQLVLFGDILNIICNEKEIYLESNGENGKMKVEIPIDNLTEFSISEGENMEISFSLQSLYKMCITTKLAKDIEIGISNDFPIRIKYDLGEDSSSIFFIAPKIIN
jgi:proliferating cell nuclear antigen